MNRISLEPRSWNSEGSTRLDTDIHHFYPRLSRPRAARREVRASTRHTTVSCSTRDAFLATLAPAGTLTAARPTARAPAKQQRTAALAETSPARRRCKRWVFQPRTHAQGPTKEAAPIRATRAAPPPPNLVSTPHHVRRYLALAAPTSPWPRHTMALPSTQPQRPARA